MAHFAEIDENNIVLRVVVIPDEEELRGQEYLSSELNLGGNWLKTSYNTRMGVHILGGTPFRKNFAAAKYKYDPTRDAFIPPAPFASWVDIDEDKCVYLPPVPMPEILPTDNCYYDWNEEIGDWVRTDLPEIY